MHKSQTGKKHLKDKGEITTVMVHAGQINELKHYIYPQSKSGGRPQQRIMTSDTSRIFIWYRGDT